MNMPTDVTKYEFLKIANALSGVCVFGSVTDAPPCAAFARFLRAPEDPSLYGEFCRSLAVYDFSFSGFLKKAVLADENRYITAIAEKRAPADVLKKNVRGELRVFSAATHISPATLTSLLPAAGYIPLVSIEPVDFEALYDKRIENLEKEGFGLFSTGVMFRLENGTPASVETPDGILPGDLIGYEEERGRVHENLEKFLSGRHAANMLLYGEAGTGKSSTVKAAVNAYAADGLRLIQLKKNELHLLPDVLARIRNNPLRFVIFIDDLSFSENDADFNMLKSVLEGGADVLTKNAVIAATSNRRHVIKETFSQREAEDEVHRGDTVSELLSLSDRFGLTVYFRKPDKALYLRIVEGLAAQAGLPLTPELRAAAETFALKKGNRSPRAARQFVDSLL